MTYILSTRAHGDIEAGFFSVFTRYARLGNHVFATKHFCTTIEEFAMRPRKHRAEILSFPLEVFWKKESEYLSKLARVIASSPKHAADAYIIEQQKACPLEHELSAFPLNIRISSRAERIHIGAYDIAAPDFRDFAAYITHGGFFGWLNQQTPEWASSAMKTLKQSKHPLFSFREPSTS